MDPPPGAASWPFRREVEGLREETHLHADERQPPPLTRTNTPLCVAWPQHTVTGVVIGGRGGKYPSGSLAAENHFH